jgi:hypothetical protein
VPARHAGIASGVNNAASRVAVLIAIAAIGAVASVEFRRTLHAAVPASAAVEPHRDAAARNPFAAPDARLDRASSDAVAVAGRRSYRLALGLTAGLAVAASLLAVVLLPARHAVPALSGRPRG